MRRILNPEFTESSEVWVANFMNLRFVFQNRSIQIPEQSGLQNRISILKFCNYESKSDSFELFVILNYSNENRIVNILKIANLKFSLYLHS